MSNGVCLLAQNNIKTDYVRQAYALALSIVAKSPNQKVSLITNDPVSDKYKKVFDQIIPIPWSDDCSDDSDWKIENRWKVYHATPYRNTMVFDVDMLVLEDLDIYWKQLQKNNVDHDILFTTQVVNYRNEVVTNRYYRRTFDANDLPNLYSGMYYFKKAETTKQFFGLLKTVMWNWGDFYKISLSKIPQEWCSFDVCTAITAKLLDRMYTVGDKNNILEFTHMKTRLQNVPLGENWTDTLFVDFNSDLELIVGGLKQSGVFHYVEDEFLTDGIINILEDAV